MNLCLKGVRLSLPHFTLEINAVLDGRVTAVFGPSGAGKTSFLEVVAGLRKPESGTVLLGETVLSDVDAGVSVPVADRLIGYVPQDAALFPHLSVRGNLTYGMVGRDQSALSLKLEEVLALLEIESLTERNVASLSGGEKQRVALGRALLISPRLLLLDEPLAGLDGALKIRLQECLKRVLVTFQIPTIYVTHSPEELFAFCDDVIVLESGKIRRQGSPAALFMESDAPRMILREPFSNI